MKFPLDLLFFLALLGLAAADAPIIRSSSSSSMAGTAGVKVRPGQGASVQVWAWDPDPDDRVTLTLGRNDRHRFLWTGRDDARGNLTFMGSPSLGNFTATMVARDGIHAARFIWRVSVTPAVTLAECLQVIRAICSPTQYRCPGLPSHPLNATVESCVRTTATRSCSVAATSTFYSQALNIICPSARVGNNTTPDLYAGSYQLGSAMVLQTIQPVELPVNVSLQLIPGPAARQYSMQMRVRNYLGARWTLGEEDAAEGVAMNVSGFYRSRMLPSPPVEQLERTLSSIVKSLHHCIRTEDHLMMNGSVGSLDFIRLPGSHPTGGDGRRVVVERSTTPTRFLRGG